MKPENVLKRLQKQFPNINFSVPDGEAWGAGKNSVHLGDAAEGGTIDGMKACDYYAYEFDPDEKFYTFGVHNKLVKYLESLGYYAECYDPGTFIAYPI